MYPNVPCDCIFRRQEKTFWGLLFLLVLLAGFLEYSYILKWLWNYIIQRTGLSKITKIKPMYSLMKHKVKFVKGCMDETLLHVPCPKSKASSLSERCRMQLTTYWAIGWKIYSGIVKNLQVKYLDAPFNTSSPFTLVIYPNLRHITHEHSDGAGVAILEYFIHNFSFLALTFYYWTRNWTSLLKNFAPLRLNLPATSLIPLKTLIKSSREGNGSVFVLGGGLQWVGNVCSICPEIRCMRFYLHSAVFIAYAFFVY